jgi:hypothetical protein
VAGQKRRKENGHPALSLLPLTFIASRNNLDKLVRRSHNVSIPPYCCPWVQPVQCAVLSSYNISHSWCLSCFMSKYPDAPLPACLSISFLLPFAADAGTRCCTSSQQYKSSSSRMA